VVEAIRERVVKVRAAAPLVSAPKIHRSERLRASNLDAVGWKKGQGIRESIGIKTGGLSWGPDDLRDP